jgi:hypothetical protein
VIEKIRQFIHSFSFYTCKMIIKGVQRHMDAAFQCVSDTVPTWWLSAQDEVKLNIFYIIIELIGNVIYILSPFIFTYLVYF